MQTDTHTPCLTPAQFREKFKNTPQPKPTMRNVAQSFGMMLQSSRINAGLKLRELEEAARVPNSLISAIEHDRRRCNANTAKKLANALFGATESQSRSEFLYAAAATMKAKGVIKDSELYPPEILDAVAEQLRRRNIKAKQILSVSLEPKTDDKSKPNLFILLHDKRRLLVTITIDEIKITT